MRALYNMVLFPLLFLGFWIISWFNPKVKEGFKLRRKQERTARNGNESWVWFHVSSGELEYAKPVLRKLKSDPLFKSKILVTYFSPSVLGSLAKTPDIDLYVPMPWDTPNHWKDFLNEYKPKALAIARTDAWPNLVWQTHDQKVPSLLFSATLPSHSGRVSSFMARLFYSSIYENLSQISCVSEEDKVNFQRLTEDVRITVDGDTRFDQVISRVSEKRPLPQWTQTLPPNVLVVGSSWEPDEAILLPSIAQALKTKTFLTILAPHEPSENHLHELKQNLEKLNLRYELFSEISASPKGQIVIIDRIGILADLYRLGSVAFVGGSFKKSVHSVMEPAASGCLTFFGPHYLNNREAIAMRRLGLAKEVTCESEITQVLISQFSLSESERKLQSEKILSFVNSNKDVSQKTAQWIVEQLRGPVQK